MSRSRSSTRVTSRSPRRIVPSVTSSSPAIMRSRVDLPQPDGPTSTRNSPSAMSRSTASTARTPPSKTFVTLSSRTPAISRGRLQQDLGRAPGLVGKARERLCAGAKRHHLEPVGGNAPRGQERERVLEVGARVGEVTGQAHPAPNEIGHRHRALVLAEPEQDDASRRCARPRRAARQAGSTPTASTATSAAPGVTSLPCSRAPRAAPRRTGERLRAASGSTAVTRAPAALGMRDAEEADRAAAHDEQRS